MRLPSAYTTGRQWNECNLSINLTRIIAWNKGVPPPFQVIVSSLSVEGLVVKTVFRIMFQHLDLCNILATGCE